MIRRHARTPIMHRVVEHNGVLYFGGIVADDRSLPMKGQTAQILAKIDKFLAEAGTDKSKILRAEIFIKDLQDFEAMNRVWDAWVPEGNAPPRATVQANLARPAWLIEIVVTAAV